MTPFGKLSYGLFEKPLQHEARDGGYVGIFRHIGCVGDSLSSGELVSTNSDGTRRYNDYYDYSWGQYLARLAGTKVSNLSKGGMTAKEFCASFGDKIGAWETAKECDAFIVALGVNEANKAHGNSLVFGTAEDAVTPGDTGLGYYTRLVEKLLEIKPDAFLFLMTVPRQEGYPPDMVQYCDIHRDYVCRLAARFPRAYVLDFRRYAPVYDKKFQHDFFLDGHLSCAGYLLTSRMVASYIDYIIRHNIRAFRQNGFIGTGLANTLEPEGGYFPD